MSQQQPDYLLEAVAQAFEELRSVDGDFLREHNVSADDCISLFTQLGAILRGYASAPTDLKTTILASGVAEPRMRELIWSLGIKEYVSKQAWKRLKS